MTEVEFIEQTKRLGELYEKPLNEEQVSLWFDNVRAFDVDTYKRAVDECFVRYRFLPTLTDMLSILKEFRNTPDNVEKVKCKACHGSGYIMYQKIINGISYDFACQCPCVNGQRVAYDGRNCQKPSEYYLEKAENIFHKSAREILAGG